MAGNSEQGGGCWETQGLWGGQGQDHMVEAKERHLNFVLSMMENPQKKGKGKKTGINWASSVMPDKTVCINVFAKHSIKPYMHYKLYLVYLS